MNKDEALKMAGYNLDGVIADVEKFDGFDNVCLETIKRVRNVIAEALEQPAQKPVGYWNGSTSFDYYKYDADGFIVSEFEIHDWKPLYTHPHQDGTSPSEARDKEFVTLTAEEIELFIFEHTKFNVNKKDDFETIKYFKNCINAIEQALKEKNHG
jgi:hypothetical protein